MTLVRARSLGIDLVIGTDPAGAGSTWDDYQAAWNLTGRELIDCYGRDECAAFSWFGEPRGPEDDDR